MKNFILFLLISSTTLFAQELESVSLQLKWKKQFQFAGFIVAKEKGFYEEVGLDVTLLEFNDSVNIFDDVQHEKVAFGVGDSSLVYQFMQGKPFIAMMALFQDSPYVLVSLDSSGIKEISDINGKAIALDNNLKGIAVEAMLKSSAIKYIKRGPAYHIDTLIEEKADLMTAYLSNEVYQSNEKNITLNVFDPKDYGFAGYGDILFTSQKMLKSRPEVVQGFYEASKRGWEYAFEHQNEVVELIYEKYNELKKSKAALVYEAEVLKYISGYGVNFGELNNEKIQGIAHMFSFMNRGYYNNDDFSSYIYSLNQIEHEKAHVTLQRYIKNLNPFYFALWLALVLFSISFILLWIVMLRRNNRKLHQILDTSIATMAIFEHGRLVDANQIAIDEFGYTLEESKGMSVFDFIDASQHDIFREKLKSSGEHYELLLKRKDGTRFWGYLKGSMLNEYTRISSVINIDELKKTQDELRMLNQTLEARVKEEIAKNKQDEIMMAQQSRLVQMGQVVNMIAHQWKGPLNTLSLLNEKLNICQGMEKLDSDKMDEFQKNSRQQIRQMSEVINDFSNFFKADKEKVSFNLMQVVKNAVEVLEPMLKEKQIEVNIEMVSGVKLLLEEGYPNKLAQAITNVVRNAKDALAQQSDNHNRWIKIRLETKERKTYLHIEDNAGGITQENINRVFDPYFSTKMQKYGTGLGLYIAKIIVEEHKGGELEVTNGNHGAHFTMTFSVAL